MLSVFFLTKSTDLRLAVFHLLHVHVPVVRRQGHPECAGNISLLLPVAALTSIVRFVGRQMLKYVLFR